MAMTLRLTPEMEQIITRVQHDKGFKTKSATINFLLHIGIMRTGPQVDHEQFDRLTKQFWDLENNIK